MGENPRKDPLSSAPGHDESATPHAHRAIGWRHRPLALGCLGDAAHAHRHRSLCLARRGARGVRARLSSPRGARRRRVDAWRPGPVPRCEHPLPGHYLVTCPFADDGGLHHNDTDARDLLLAEARRLCAEQRASHVVIRTRAARTFRALHGHHRYQTAVVDLAGGADAVCAKSVSATTRNQVRRGQKEGFRYALGPPRSSLSTASSTPTCASWARPLTRSATMN